MKRYMHIITVAVLAMLVCSGIASAQVQAESRVRVRVDPYIALTAGGLVDLGTVQTGTFNGTIPFQINANVEELWLQVLASNLYKGDDETSPFVIPVAGSGAVVQPMGGGSAVSLPTNLVPWNNGSGVALVSGTVLPNSNEVVIAGGVPVGVYVGNQTALTEFSSSQNGHFSQAVNVGVTWDQINPELPTGVYGGIVRMVAALQP